MQLKQVITGLFSVHCESVQGACRSEECSDRNHLGIRIRMHVARLYRVHAGLAFQGLSVFEVGLAVFMGRMDFLVDHILICGGELGRMSKCELKEMLRERLRPVSTTA